MAVKLDKWLTAQKRHKLSDRHVQMLRELGLNPDKLGKIDNHKQEVWKVPLPQFIEEIYFKRFKREEPLSVKSIKELMTEEKIKKEKQKKGKEKKRSAKLLNENSLIEDSEECKTPITVVDSSEIFLLLSKEPEIKIKLESGDSHDTILQKEAHLFDRAFDSIGQDEVSLSQLGFELKKIHPRYKPRRYGCKTLGAVYEKLKKYELIRTGAKGIYDVIVKKK